MDLQEYLPVLLFILVGVVVGVAPQVLGFVFGPNRPDAQKNSPYECGFEAFEDARMKFDVRYYLVAILFILFDLEIAFLFPWAVSLRDIGATGFWAMMVFLGILVVGWFQSFKTPLTIMLAIPFSLVGILPAHALAGAFFTATSMIGFIAGAGIVVRNSIILVDFIELRLREGMPLDAAVIDAGAVRFRPMALTAAAVIAGSAVILFDPIFQGLAISLVFGAIVSTVLTLLVVPLIYYMTEKKKWEKIHAEMASEYDYPETIIEEEIQPEEPAAESDDQEENKTP